MDHSGKISRLKMAFTWYFSCMANRLLILLFLVLPPIQLSTPDSWAADGVSWNPAAITTANTAKDGTGSVSLVMQASDTTYVDRLVFRAAGTNVATVARVFLNNGESNSVAANNVLFAETTLEATTLSEVAALSDEVLALDVHLPPGYRIFVTIGTSVSAGWRVTAVSKTPTEVLE